MSWLDATAASAPIKSRTNIPAVGFALLTIVCAVALAMLLLPRGPALSSAVLLASLGVAAGGIEILRRTFWSTTRKRAQSSAARQAAFAALDTEPFFVTASDGAMLYASAAYRKFAGLDPSGLALPVSRLIGSEMESMAAVYRLNRAAAQMIEAEETIPLAPRGGAVGRYRFSVRPLRGTAGALWRLHSEIISPVVLVDSEARVIAIPNSADSNATAAQPATTSFEAAARVVDEAPVGIAIVDSKGNILQANRHLRRLAEKSAEADGLAGLLAPEDAAHISQRLASPAEGGPFEVRMKGESDHTGQLFIVPLAPSSEDAAPTAVIYVLDTTEHKTLELQFAQSQKMQAVGQLAGGIAHDFNNVLTAILGFCDLLLTRHPAGDPSFADIMQVHQNATRAAGLVRQLLAFSRQQTLRPTVIWLPDALAENKGLLARLMGERVRLDISHARDVGLVKVDEVQLVQVLMNLAANARDAMPEGGTLSIRTRNISRKDSEDFGHDLLTPAEYVLLEVADTGTGIPKEILGKIFEPFFTTKEVGQGTGLGLSTVYGIVKQTQGFIFPESEMGEGTTFRIFLPRHFEEAQTIAPAAAAAPVRAQDHTGRGTILLVEDEDAVRSFASRALTSRGYTVMEAESGEAALAILNDTKTSLDLMISDVVMPAMDGPTLVREVKGLRPDLKIILVSGYAEDAFRKTLKGTGGKGEEIAFLPKPFSLKQLISKVKEVIDAA